MNQGIKASLAGWQPRRAGHRWGYGRAGLAALAMLGLAQGGFADPGIRFDSADSKPTAQPRSLLDSVREATKGTELPAIKATKDAAAPAVPKTAAAKPEKAAATLEGAKRDPAFWGSDGRWCPDGQAYYGGPCDYGWGGGYGYPYRGPYDNPNYYRSPYYGAPYYGGPYYGGPYYRTPYYGGPTYSGPTYSGPSYHGPGQGPTRQPWKDPPTRR